MIKDLLSTVAFLSRLPVFRFMKFDNKICERMPMFFVPAGMVIGLAQGLLPAVLWVLLGFDHGLLAVIALIWAVMVTGGLHEDGLADVADASACASKQRKLEIMKDSRIGVYGALTLGFVLLLKWKCLEIFLRELPAGWAGAFQVVLLSASVGGFSRAAMLIVFVTSTCIQCNGLAASLSRPSLESSVMQFLLLAVFCCWVPPEAFALYVAGTAACGIFLALYFRRSFGGITGDCLGASVCIGEVIMLILASHFLAHIR